MNKGKEEGLRSGDKLMGPEATGKESLEKGNDRIGVPEGPRV